MWTVEREVVSQMITLQQETYLFSEICPHDSWMAPMRRGLHKRRLILMVLHLNFFKHGILESKLYIYIFFYFFYVAERTGEYFSGNSQNNFRLFGPYENCPLKTEPYF